MISVEEQKKIAAEKAVDKIKDGMIVGLGTGSTTKFAILKLAEKLKTGQLKNIKCIASSTKTENLAKQNLIELISLNELYNSSNVNKIDFNDYLKNDLLKEKLKLIDIYIDGADEVDKENNLIKGGGGALLREKILAESSKKFIVIVDESKLSEKLGTKFYLPVEVFQFSYLSEKKFFESFGFKTTLRMIDGKPFITDENNYILDVQINPLENPKTFYDLLNNRAGIVQHGLFLGNIVSEVIVGK